MFLRESWWKRGGRRRRRRSALYNNDGGLYGKGGGATLAPLLSTSVAGTERAWSGSRHVPIYLLVAHKQTGSRRRIVALVRHVSTQRPPSSHQLTRLSITRDEAKDAVSIAEEAITDGQRPRVQHHNAQGISSVCRRRN